MGATMTAAGLGTFLIVGRGGTISTGFGGALMLDFETVGC